MFALTGCATVLSATAAAAAKHPDWEIPLNLVLVLVTVAAGIVSSIEALRKPSQLWILERSVYHALKDLKRELKYEGSRVPDPQVDLYFKRMQSILAASSEQWTVQVTPHKEPESTPKTDETKR